MTIESQQPSWSEAMQTQKLTNILNDKTFDSIGALTSAILDVRNKAQGGAFDAEDEFKFFESALGEMDPHRRARLCKHLGISLENPKDKQIQDIMNEVTPLLRQQSTPEKEVL